MATTAVPHDDRGIATHPITLAGTVRDLELGSVDWPATQRRGYFGHDHPWER